MRLCFYNVSDVMISCNVQIERRMDIAGNKIQAQNKMTALKLVSKMLEAYMQRDDCLLRFMSEKS